MQKHPSFVQYPIIIKDVNKVSHESWMTALEGCGNVEVFSMHPRGVSFARV